LALSFCCCFDCAGAAAAATPEAVGEMDSSSSLSGESCCDVCVDMLRSSLLAFYGILCLLIMGQVVPSSFVYAPVGAGKPGASKPTFPPKLGAHKKHILFSQNWKNHLKMFGKLKSTKTKSNTHKKRPNTVSLFLLFQ
jgi:hypothetical protein